MDLALAQALWVLGLLPSDQLPRVAAEALKEGVDSVALRMLASLMQDELLEAPALFGRALKELGLASLSRRDAACVYATTVCKQILSGELSPMDGAARLWDTSIRVNEPGFHDLDTFIYAASELQSRPEDRDFFNAEIRKAAEVWVLKRDV